MRESKWARRKASQWSMAFNPRDDDRVCEWDRRYRLVWHTVRDAHLEATRRRLQDATVPALVVVDEYQGSALVEFQARFRDLRKIEPSAAGKVSSARLPVNVNTGHSW